MRVERVEVLGFRNLASASVEIGGRVTVVHGPNGAGKTNLLEAIYFGLTGHACRPGGDRALIAHGGDAARVELDLAGPDGSSRALASLSRDGERRHRLDERPMQPAGEGRPLVSVFLPDRLQIVKGAPAQRRSHLDRFIAALWPARADLRSRFGRALAQRNALVSRVRAGVASAASLAAWDDELAAEAAPLIAARREAVGRLAGPFAKIAERLGLPGVTIVYRPRAEEGGDRLAAELGARRAAGLERAYTGHGPQMDEVRIALGPRSLRRFGSQGEQRTALLALCFAERVALIDAGRPPPLMLLDDVMSELDVAHRDALIAEVMETEGLGQAVITATEADHVPVEVGAGCRRVAIRAGAAAQLSEAA